MAGVNKVILVGNLGKDPEVRVLENDRKVAKFTLATTESYKDKMGNRVENTEWHNVEFWGPIVDVIQKYLHKGSQVYVEGKLSTRSYDDKETGQKKYITSIVGQNMTMLGGRREGGDEYQQPPRHENEPPKASPSPIKPEYVNTDNDIDDLPF